MQIYYELSCIEKEKLFLGTRESLNNGVSSAQVTTNSDHEEGG